MSINRRARILVIDDGGIKCWSSLRILERVLGQIQSGNGDSKPCEYFDLIVGSGTGGLLALLLGRFQLSIHQCFEAMRQCIATGSGKLKKNSVSQLVESIFNTLEIPLDEPYSRQSEDNVQNPRRCRTCIVAVQAFKLDHFRTPYRLRSYSSREEPAPTKCLAREVAHMCLNFEYHPDELVKVGNLECAAGSHVFPNPIRIAFSDSLRIWPLTGIRCIISLGSPRYVDPKASSSASLRNRMTITAETAIDPIRLHLEFKEEADRLGFDYIRLEVPSLNKIYAKDWKKTQFIDDESERYLQFDETEKQMKTCSTLLNLPFGQPQSTKIEQVDFKVSDLEEHRTANPDKEYDTKIWLRFFKEQVHPVMENRKWDNQKIKIAVLDTGISLDHPAAPLYKTRIIAGKGWTLSKDDYDDQIGHGTNIAFLIMALAPAAELYICKVFEKRNGDGDSLKHINLAIRHAILEWDVDIITMAFGFDHYSDELAETLHWAQAKGKLLISAASNKGGLAQAAFPARSNGVICANSATGTGIHSSFNPSPSLSNDNFTFLGESVPILNPDLSFFSNDQFCSGTSVATAVAVGIAAFVLELCCRRPLLPVVTRSRLKSYVGMRKMFTLMTASKNSIQTGFHFVEPWSVIHMGLSEDAIRDLIIEKMNLL